MDAKLSRLDPCCENMAAEGKNIFFLDGFTGEIGAEISMWDGPNSIVAFSPMKFCPWCGSKIFMKGDTR